MNDNNFNNNNKTPEHVEEIGAVWYYGRKGVQSYSIEDGLKRNHNFFVAKDEILEINGEKKATKSYASYKSLNDFLYFTRKYENDGNFLNFYETVLEDKPCRLYCDLEWSLNWCSVYDIKSKLFELLVYHIPELKNNELIYTNSCNEKENKGSLHMITPCYYFDSLKEQKAFWEKIYLDLSIQDNWFFLDETDKSYILKTFIDFGVYTKNRIFRTIGSYKLVNFELVRPLKLESELVDYKDAFITFINGQEKKIKIDDCDFFHSYSTQKHVWNKNVLQKVCDIQELGVDIDVLNKNKNVLLCKNKRKVDDTTDVSRVCKLSGEVHDWKNSRIELQGNKAIFKCASDKCSHLERVILKLPEIKPYLAKECPFDYFMKSYYKILKEEQDIYAYDKWLKKVCLFMNDYFIFIKANKPYVLERRGEYNSLTDRYDVEYVARKKNDLFDTFLHKSFNILNPVLDKKGNIEWKQKGKTNFITEWYNHSYKISYYGEDTCNPEIRKPRDEYFNCFSNIAITKDLALENGNIYDDGVIKWLDFIKTAWCHNDDRVYNYVIKWFAHLVQKPMVKTNKAIVLKGNQGVGKSMVYHTLMKIIGDNYCAQPSGYEQIFGNFNSLLDNKILVFADELVWGGCKKDAGKLKKFITEPHLYSNEKHMTIRKLNNESNWLIASNEEWVVPAGNKERRYIILNVSDDMLEFNVKEKKRIAEVCPFSLAAYLYSIDLTDWDSTEIIDTEGLADQKMLGLNNVARFWMEFITDRDYIIEGGKRNACSIYNDYVKYCDENKEKHVGKISFYKMTKDIIGVEKQRRMSNGIREYVFSLESYDFLRRNFNSYMGSTCIVFDNDIEDHDDGN